MRFLPPNIFVQDERWAGILLESCRGIYNFTVKKRPAVRKLLLQFQ